MSEATHDESIDSHCNLPADQLEARKRELRRAVAPHVRHQEPLENGRAWEFESSLHQTLEELVAFERQCCSGLDWRLETVAASGLMRLELRGFDPGPDALSPPPQPERNLSTPTAGGSPLARVAKAGGLGLGLSFFLLCVVPIALTALGGASLASQISGLESPATLAAGGLALAGLAWWRMRRRERGARPSQRWC